MNSKDSFHYISNCLIKKKCFISFGNCSNSQVITTHGPRKPQRQSSNVNLSIESELDVMMTPTNSQHICLETSFTSLQSPSVEPFPLISCSSKGSSMAGSLFSRSQLNSILHGEGNGSAFDEQLFGRSISAGPSEATTVILADQVYRGKSVAFDIKSSHASVTSPSPNFLLKSILHRQNASNQDPLQKSNQPHQPTPSISNNVRQLTKRKIDFKNDNWFGLAPLASPETLSEISSISSRTSLTFNLASSIENYLHRLGSPLVNDFMAPTATVNENELSESQMHTPKVMRRAPKITGNLSKCADDWQLVDKYKRMGKVFVTNPVHLFSSSDSSGGSFESTHSLTKPKCCTNATGENSKSADNLDNDSSRPSFNTTKMRMSDSAILEYHCFSKCPNCPCKQSNSSLRLECCQRKDHSWCVDSSDDQQNQTSSTSDTYHSATSSLVTISTQNNPIRLPSGVLESHFPVYSEGTINETTSLLSSTVTKGRSPKIKRKTGKQTNGSGNNSGGIANKNDAGFKRFVESDRRFSRNDSLPLLADLVERNSPNSFNRRRNYTVYPITSSPSKRNESNV